MSKNKQIAQLRANFGKIKTETFDFSKIERFYLLSDKKNVYQVISDRTFQDLDMGEVFMFIDRTISRVGQQFLYSVLRTIPGNSKRCDKFEEIINVLNANPDIRDHISLEISLLTNKDAYYISSLFLENHIPKPKWFWVIPALSLISFSLVLLSFLFPKALIFLVLILAINFGIHYWNKINLYKYSGSIPQLLLLNQVAEKITKLPVLNGVRPEVIKSIGVINSLGMQMSLFKLEVKLQSEIGLAVEYFVELIKALFLIEPLVLYNVLKELDSRRKEVQEVYEFIGELDAAISISFLRNDVPYFCFPSITSCKKQVTATEVYHPLIYQPIPNSIDLNERSALLTGSNMSGKTTFIRTIGINAITAQTINTCFAREFNAPILKVHSAVRISDDLLSEKSYYFEEVLTIKSLLEESTSGFQNLFLLDELFKGTNTVERIASGKAVLAYLDKGENIVFVATHDLELAGLLENKFSLYHFTEIVQDGAIAFDYKIKTGNLRHTNAIRILELNGYPREVTDEATFLANRIYNRKTAESRQANDLPDLP